MLWKRKGIKCSLLLLDTFWSSGNPLVRGKHLILTKSKQCTEQCQLDYYWVKWESALFTPWPCEKNLWKQQSFWALLDPSSKVFLYLSTPISISLSLSLSLSRSLSIYLSYLSIDLFPLCLSISISFSITLFFIACRFYCLLSLSLVNLNWNWNILLQPCSRIQDLNNV